MYVFCKFVWNVNSRVTWNTLTDINNGYRTMYPNISMIYVPMSRAYSCIRDAGQWKRVRTVGANMCSHAGKIWTPGIIWEKDIRTHKIKIKYYSDFVSKCWNIRFSTRHYTSSFRHKKTSRDIWRQVVLNMAAYLTF